MTALGSTRGDNVFVRGLSSGLEYQPAVIELDKDPAEEEEEDYLRDQQRRLVEYVRRAEEEEGRGSQARRKGSRRRFIAGALPFLRG